MRIFLLSFCFFVGTMASSFAQNSPLERVHKLVEVAAYDSALQVLKTISASAHEVEKSLLSSEAHLGKGEIQSAFAELQNVRGKVSAENLSAFIPLQVLSSRAFLRSGEVREAEEALNKALSVLEKTKTPKKSEFYAEVYAAMGVLFWTEGERERGKDFQEQALKIREALYDFPSLKVAASHNDLGLLYAGNAEALSHYAEALRHYEAIFPAGHPKVAAAHTNIGFEDLRQERLTKAQESFKKALEILYIFYEEKHPRIAFLKSSLAQVAQKSEDDEEAESLYRAALKSYTNYYGEKHPEVASTHNTIADLKLRQGDYKSALSHCEAAFVSNTREEKSTQFPTTQEAINPMHLLQTYYVFSQSLEKKYALRTRRFRDLSQALQALDSAEVLLKALQKTRSLEADKLALGKIAEDIYAAGVSLCLRMATMSLRSAYYRERAFIFAESGKASVLQGAITASNARKFAGIPEALLREEEQLRGKTLRLERELLEANSATQDSLFAAQREYESFVRALEKNYPKYYALKYQDAKTTVADVQKGLSPSQVMYSYYLTPSRLYVFRLSNKKLDAWDVATEETERHIHAFRQSIHFGISEVFAEAGTYLRKKLFLKKPGKAHPQVIIIPHGALSTLPFEALPLKTSEESFSENTYLISQHSFSYAYSSQLFLESQKEKIKDGQIVLFAPTEFEQATSLPNLPGTQQEVCRIDTLFSDAGLTSEAFLRKKANASRFRALSEKRYKYLHLATHGVVDEAEPGRSRLLFYGEAEQKEEPALYASELYNLDLRADLITLSACETGLGQLVKGEGLLGLSRAFLYAGANNLMVSFWKVNDEATAKLMIKFYEFQLKNPSNSYGQSLRQAKLALLKEEAYNSPEFWAAFILIGE